MLPIPIYGGWCKVTRTLTKHQAEESGLANTISYNEENMKLQNASTTIELKHVDTQIEENISV